VDPASKRPIPRNTQAGPAGRNRFRNDPPGLLKPHESWTVGALAFVRLRVSAFPVEFLYRGIRDK
jgi:hypothetical protein